MRIHGLTVCVQYAEWLAQGLACWMSGLSSLTVVTAHGDAETLAVAHYGGARVFVTDAFYRDGASFNKGRAMEEAREQMPWEDWILFFDADVVPPDGWADRLARLQPGRLYGCRRFEADAGDIDDIGQPSIPGDGVGVGYFQLFHSGDPCVQQTPLLETHWKHAGNYDNAFMNRWRKKGIHIGQVPFRVAHIGERENWFGRGKQDAFNDMLIARAKHDGLAHERIKVTA